MKRILIIHPDGNVNDNPNLSEFCNILYSKGFLINILSPRQKHIPYQTPAKCKADLILVDSMSDMFSLPLTEYSFVLGIDKGIVQAEHISKKLSVPYGFLSYEIIFDDEIRERKDRIEKERIRKACADVCFAIVQDKVRGSFLEKEYGINSNIHLFMPVAGNECVKYERSHFLHEQLNIPKEKNILLYMGTVADWSMIDRVCEKADVIPENWVFVIHCRYGNYNKVIKHPKIFYSYQQQPDLKDMAKVIQSASCCLAIYNPTYSALTTGKNLKYIGLASGKISMALQHGVTVAINEMGEISEFVRKYDAGIVVDMQSEKPFEKLSELNDNAERVFSCHKLFNEKLSIGNFADGIIGAIENGQTRIRGWTSMMCPVCKSLNIKNKLIKYDDRYACPGIFKIGRCLNCGHHFVLDANGINIGNLYTDYYPRKNIQDGYLQPVFNSKVRFYEWFDGDKCPAYRNVSENVKVLDIGCGDCTSLFYHQSRGCDVTGIEADENVAFLKKRFGDNLIIGEFKKELFQNELFDYVTMDQVVEHFENPLKKLMEVNEVLAKNGRIILSTPNSSGWRAKLFGKYWINWHTPYHLNLFSKKSIRIALETAGFKNIQIKTITSSEWLSYQWFHILFYPENGDPSYFWSDEEKKKTISVKKGRRKISRYIYNLLHKTKINHIITRIFDCLGMGDNMLIIAEKK